MIEYKDKLEQILSLSKEEIDTIFSQMSLNEISLLLNKMNEVTNNE